MTGRLSHWWRVGIVMIALSVLLTGDPAVISNHAHPVSFAPGAPDANGYFHTRPAGAWSNLPGDRACARRVHESAWEPRPDNQGPNHRMPNRTKVHRAFKLRPVAVGGAYNRRWDSWLLQRVTGHHTGTTDENIQWAACKWGISDNLLRAVTVRESTWFHYEVYPSGRCVTNWGCGDMIDQASRATLRYCSGISNYGHDYERDYGTGKCPKTFSIAGVMSWQAPEWGKMRANQNGTFPFNRNSTAFALDYLGSYLRGCQEGWEYWLDNTGTGDYAPGKIWGCVGSWFAGAWRTPEALGYVGRVRDELENKTWLRRSFRSTTPPCSDEFGCPQGS